MALTSKSLEKMSDAIIDDVAQYISEDPRFVDLLSELVLDAIHQQICNIDPKIRTQLVQSISSKLRCSANYSEVFYPRCPI